MLGDRLSRVVGDSTVAVEAAMWGRLLLVGLPSL